MSPALNAGKYDSAVRQLSAAIGSDSISPGEAAKALYLRGIAYRKLNQPARAISDLGAAMWLGLSALRSSVGAWSIAALPIAPPA